MPKTFKELSEQVVSEVFPDGQPENLIAGHRSILVAGLRDIARYVDCVKDNNTDVYPFCSTFFTCGATVIEKPPGSRIQRVYTLVGNCCPIFYDNIKDYDEFLNWIIANRLKWTEPPNVGLPHLPQGFKFSEASTDKGVRFEWGNYCIHNDRIYIGHRIESSEKVVVEWSGVKNVFKDEDFVPEEHEVVMALMHYLKAHHSLRYMDDPKAFSAENLLYENTRADLIYDCEQSKRAKDAPDRKFNQLPVQTTSASAMPDHCVSEEEDEEEVTTIGIIGDFGNASAAEQDVATLIDSWGPDAIVTVGDNWYGSTVSEAALDQKAGAYFRKYIFPYHGTAGEQIATEQQFFACIGNHDRSPEGRFDISRAFWNLPSHIKNSSNLSKGYYDVVIGPVHFFILDSGYNSDYVLKQEDGNTSTSIQAAWLRIAMNQSKSPWRVVVLHHAPFSSQDSGGSSEPALEDDGSMSHPALQWPFKAWGANLVLSGHSHGYERLTVDGLNYIVAGNGGQSLDNYLNTPLTDSVVRYNADYGAVKIAATTETLTVKSITRTGTVVDTLELTR